jgi:hypothetical protein
MERSKCVRTSALTGSRCTYAIEPPATQDEDLEPETIALDAPAPSLPRLAVGGAFLLRREREEVAPD